MPETLGTDGVVTLRAPRHGDAALLIEGRDDESRRWLGPGSAEPAPTACIIVGGDVVGWVDYDTDRDWLRADEVNIGYSVFADHRRRGYASRAVTLLLGHLGRSTPYRTATLLIDPQNLGSLAVAASLGCEAHGLINGSSHFKIAVPSEGG